MIFNIFRVDTQGQIKLWQISSLFWLFLQAGKARLQDYAYLMGVFRKEIVQS